jgi:hypothetical protein
MRTRRISRLACLGLLVAAGAVGRVSAGAHTWDVKEIFSTADGSIWLIELWEANGTSGETFVAGRPVKSLTKNFTIANNVTAPTTHKHLLFGNPAFAALPGAPPPDQVVNINNFFSITSDTITYDPYDTMSFTAGQLPTDGENSLNQVGDNIVILPNSPTNYAGQSGHVVVASGSGETTVLLRRAPLNQVRLDWTASCEPNDTKYGIYQGNLATLASGYNHAASVCNVVGLTRNVTPAHPSTYFLVVPAGPASEGSYGEGVSGPRPPGGSPCAAQDVSCTLP